MITPNGGVFGRNPKFNTVTTAQNISVNSLNVGAGAGGLRNTVLGTNAGALLGTGQDDNTLVGHGAGDVIGTGSSNGFRNVAIGSAALGSCTTGYSNVAVGYQALTSMTTALSNVAVGSAAGLSLSTGLSNLALGSAAMVTNSTGTGNVAIGTEALYLGTGGDNVAVGRQAGDALTTGNNNTFIGTQCDPAAATNTGSIVIGYQAVGDGTNTTVIGTSSTTSARMAGTATSRFEISGDTMRITGTRTPASNAAGTAGDFAFGTDGATTYLYYCIASGNWGRVALTTGY